MLLKRISKILYGVLLIGTLVGCSSTANDTKYITCASCEQETKEDSIALYKLPDGKEVYLCTTPKAYDCKLMYLESHGYLDYCCECGAETSLNGNDVYDESTFQMTCSNCIYNKHEEQAKICRYCGEEKYEYAPGKYICNYGYCPTHQQN